MMSSLILFGLLALVTLALPLAIYKHKLWIIAVGCIAEAVCIGLIYGSTFITCSDKNSCDSDWAATTIPLLIMAMNLGMIWPILAGYAKQAKKDLENSQAEKKES